MSVLHKLLSHLHKAVFDIAPAPELAFRLTGPGLCSWAIADELITVTNGTLVSTLNLNQYTVGQLTQQLALAGFTVENISSEFVGMSALVLTEGDGTTDVPAFTNDLWSLFSGFAKEVRAASLQVPQALRQMRIPDAEAEWLDVHGKLYDQPRQANQTDESYAVAIPREAFRIRVNALAIEQAVFDATGKAVVIEEPFEFMFRLSESTLSGPDRLYDGTFVGPCLIQPSTRMPIDWSDVLPVIQRNKAAGVIVLSPISRPSLVAKGGLTGKVSTRHTQIRGGLVSTKGEGRLDFLALSDEYRSPRNYSASVSISVAISSLDNNCPVGATLKTYQFSGATWLYAREWGAFAWNSDISTDELSLSPGANITLNEIEIWN